MMFMFTPSTMFEENGDFIRIKTLEGMVLEFCKDFIGGEMHFNKAKRIVHFFDRDCELPLAEHYAEFIRNAYARKGDAVIEYFLNSFFYGRYFWCNNAAVTLTNGMAVSKIIIDHPVLMTDDGKNYTIQDYPNLDDIFGNILNAILDSRYGSMYEHIGFGVYKPKDSSGIRIIPNWSEDYADFIGATDYLQLANNPFMIALFNGIERANAVAEYITDAVFFGKIPAKIYAFGKNDIKVVGIGSTGNSNGFSVNASVDPGLRLFYARGVRQVCDNAHVR